MNENDSEKISGMLKQMGHQATEDENTADFILLNTCSVRENANEKFFGHLGYYKNLKKKRPDLVLGVCGCMMQQEQVVAQIKSKHRHVDLVFGTHNLHELPELLDNHFEKEEMIVGVWNEGGKIVENIPVDHKYSFKAYVSIMFGCNNFCSYCIVPYTRGRERSRTPKSIYHEVEELAKEGCKEVTLLGQNVNSYGKTLEEEISFAELLKQLTAIDGIERIRFMTSHPKDISDELIDVVAAYDKICNHIHLPVQAGSNAILKAMNRGYSREDYLDLIAKIRDRVGEDVAVTTDLIVGFPGESEEDFNKTLELMEECRFDSAFTFLYSPREGTPASRKEEQIPEEVKHQRLNRLLAVHNQIGREKNDRYVGNIVKVLVEGPSKNKKQVMTGRTESNKTVNFEGDESLTGQIVEVEIVRAKTFSLDGKWVESR
ncbi:MAG TPA: tRNA (N6-isopentenyl adenosine(37)-C2)-methylthiotransferase MiaB [Eubacteriaceae bacterium]|nr:tRNA (N6-isopentenyl adenosine(37)-C2)-methylthiotransferase MiaB [Eubacteriaceae bacterium]